MAQITKKWIQSNAVDGSKIRLSNNENLKARNAADSADVDVVKVNASDRIEFASVPQSPADASTSNDLVRFSQLATLVEGLKPKQAVRAATVVAGTLASSFENGDTVDGVVLATGDRLLIKDQAAPEENGIYTVNATGAPTRALDFNSPSEIPGSYTVAQEGSVNQGTLFVCLSSPTVIGTDPITFAARAAQTYSGGDMISLTGNVFSVDLASVSGLESSNPGNAAGQLRVKLEASNPSLQISGSNELGAKLNASGAIVSGASGLSVQVDASTVKINGSNQLESLKELEEEVVLSGGDITNQYIDLAHAIYGASASVNSLQLFVVGGPMQRKAVDYTVSLAGGAGGVTRVSFAGDLATGGAAALVATDIVVVQYSYLT